MTTTKWANPPKTMFWDFNTGRHTYSVAEALAWIEDGGDVREYTLKEEAPPLEKRAGLDV
jgi:hypothetical protein